MMRGELVFLHTYRPSRAFVASTTRSYRGRVVNEESIFDLMAVDSPDWVGLPFGQKPAVVS